MGFQNADYPPQWQKAREPVPTIASLLKGKDSLVWHIDGKCWIFSWWFFCFLSFELLFYSHIYRLCWARGHFPLGPLSLCLWSPWMTSTSFSGKKGNSVFWDSTVPRHKQLSLGVRTWRGMAWPPASWSPGSSRHFWCGEAQLWIQANTGCWFQLKSNCIPSSSRLWPKI